MEPVDGKINQAGQSADTLGLDKNMRTASQKTSTAATDTTPASPSNHRDLHPHVKDSAGPTIIRLHHPVVPNNDETFEDVPDLMSIRVRSFRTSDDAAAVRRLYQEGLLGGQLAENDTGIDIDDVESAYFCSGSGHFWVAVNEQEEVIGTIGVQSHDEGVGEIRRLRVHPNHRRRGVGSRLLEQAIRFCREANFLKIMLDTHIEREPAIKLFEKFHFRHGRTRQTNGKQLLVFYLDLYSDDSS